MPVPDWPTQDAGLALHRRLLDHDPVAPPFFMAAYYLPLLAELGRRNPKLDDDLLADVVSKLFFAFVQKPDQYNPAKLTLRAYLLMAAGGDVKNALRDVGRRKQKSRETPLESVAEPAADGNEEQEDDIREWLNHPLIVAEIEQFTRVEQEIWRLMLAGERRTGVYAAVLNITHFEAAEREREVKKVKERLKMRLKRLREKLP